MADKLTVPQFAAKIRAKYPGSYDSVPDAELAQRVVSKYPVYADSVDMSQPSQPTTPTAVLSRPPSLLSMAGLKSAFYDAVDKASEGLPAAGATAGALIGAGSGVLTGGTSSIPGAIGGAGIGGMAGEAARQLVRRGMGYDSPQTPLQAASAITKEGAIQGGVQAVSEGVPLLAGPVRNMAVKQYERALAPTTKINKAIVQDRAQQMMDRGIAGNLDFIGKDAAQNANALRQPLDAAYDAVNPSATKGSGDSIIASLENLKNKYVVNGQVAQPQAVKAIEGVQDIVRQYGSDISPKSLRQLKQIFDEPVAAKGGFAGADLSVQYGIKAQKAAANSIRDILNSASPDVAALNKEMSFWLDVKRVAEQSGLRKTGQEGGLMKTLWPLAAGAAGGAGIGSAAGAGASAGAATAVILTQLATRAVRSPLWRTTSAVMKNAFADAIAREDTRAAAALLARAGIAVGQSLSQPPQGDLPTSPSEQLQLPPQQLR